MNTVLKIHTKNNSDCSTQILPPHLGGTSDTYGGNPLNNVIVSTGTSDVETFSSASSRVIEALKDPFKSSKDKAVGKGATATSSTSDEGREQTTVGSGSMVQGAIIEIDVYHHSDVGEVDVKRRTSGSMVEEGKEKKEEEHSRRDRQGREELDSQGQGQGHAIEVTQVGSDRNATGNIKRDCESRWSSEGCNSKSRGSISNSNSNDRGDLNGNCILDSSSVTEILTDVRI